MTDTVYVTGDPLFVGLLNIAGEDPAYGTVGGETFGDELEKGYFMYRVETRYLAVTYTARPVELDGDGMPIRYVVIKRVYEIL